MGGGTVTLDNSGSTTFAGAIRGSGGGLAKTGVGTLTLTGTSATPRGTWQLLQGTLALSGATVTAGGFTQSAGTTLALASASTSRVLTASGPVHLAGKLQLTLTSPPPR